MPIKGFVIRVKRMQPNGMALFPFILIKTKPTPSLIYHERIHLRQQLEMGLLLFYLWYGVEYMIRYFQYKNHFRAYFNISFEREAYRNEHNHNYLKTRRCWAFLRYL